MSESRYPPWGEEKEDTEKVESDLEYPESLGAPSSTGALQGGDAFEEDVTTVSDLVFYKQALTRDPEKRVSALSSIREKLLNDFASQRHGSVTDEGSESETTSDPGAREDNTLLALRLLALESPFSDVRDFARQMLHDLGRVQDIGLLEEPSPTLFEPASVCPRVEPDSSQLRDLFRDEFVRSGRVSHLTRLLGWHPEVLRRFIALRSKLFAIEGPLPLTWRLYLAIIASARHDSVYLVSELEREFLSAGGNPTWLAGIANIDCKLEQILSLNAHLAHRPWDVTEALILATMRGSGAEESAWSMPELIHGITILCFFHGISALTLGCGISPEIDFVPKSTVARMPESAEADPKPESLLMSLSEVTVQEKTDGTKPAFDEEVERGENRTSPSDASLQKDQAPPLHFEHYIGAYKLEHKDFDFGAKGRDSKMLRTQDFSWKDHGFPTISRFYDELAEQLDDFFDFVSRLTYRNFFASSDVDTSPFRNAVWFYVHRISGVQHDDYDYERVNQDLKKMTKIYIKKVACTPRLVTSEEWSNFG
mmetsp:Transcript_31833/g.83101  ORF Transcript_31833/g.83101 Transcript_31833/m.83101 type:complete len:538 (-) Transcript_31833:525-2138(-)